MAEGSKRPTVKEDRSLEAMWATQANIARQLEILTTEFFRFSMEMKTEIRSLRTNRTQQSVGRPVLPATTPALRPHVGRRLHTTIPVISDSEDYREGFRNQPIVVDNYPPLELPLRWSDPPPENPPLELPLPWRDLPLDRTVHNLPATGIPDSLPLQPHPITRDSTSASSRNLASSHDKNEDSNSFQSDSGPDTSSPSLLLSVRAGDLKPTSVSTQQLQHDLPLPHPQHSTCDSLSDETTADVTLPSPLAPNMVIPASSFCFLNKSVQPVPLQRDRKIAVELEEAIAVATPHDHGPAPLSSRNTMPNSTFETTDKSFCEVEDEKNPPFTTVDSNIEKSSSSYVELLTEQQPQLNADFNPVADTNIVEGERFVEASLPPARTNRPRTQIRAPPACPTLFLLPDSQLPSTSSRHPVCNQPATQAHDPNPLQRDSATIGSNQLITSSDKGKPDVILVNLHFDISDDAIDKVAQMSGEIIWISKNNHLGVVQYDRGFSAFATLGNERCFTSVALYNKIAMGENAALVVSGNGLQSKAKNNIKLCLSSSLEFAEVNGHVMNDAGEVEMIPANTTANREQKLVRIDPFDFEMLGVPGVQRHDYDDFNSKLSELLFGQILFSIISQNGWANTAESMETQSLVSWSTMTNAHVKLEIARNYYGDEVFQHFGGAIRNGFEPFAYISNGLMSLHAKCGEIKSSSKVFDEMAEKNLFLWNALIGEFNNNHLPQMALEFVDGVRSLLCDSRWGKESIPSANYVVIAINGGLQICENPKEFNRLMNKLADRFKRRRIFDPGGLLMLSHTPRRS